MNKFKIIAAPPGQAPEWVRNEWIGLELPLDEPANGVQMGVLGGQAENVGGCAVRGDIAIDLLEGKSPDAAQWWKVNAPHVMCGRLVFARDVCEIFE
ncbi:MAG: hypothetical protein M0Q93_02130 [Terrimicrobiaceae bacterium]|nr:hypothetical protein [Terrimicrobiaceae bacterium]